MYSLRNATQYLVLHASAFHFISSLNGSLHLVPVYCLRRVLRITECCVVNDVCLENKEKAEILAVTTIRFLCYQMNAEARTEMRRLCVFLGYTLHAGHRNGNMDLYCSSRTGRKVNQSQVFLNNSTWIHIYHIGQI